MRKIALVLMCLLWCATSCLSSEKIDVYTLAERGTLEQLQEALENGAKFNVSRATQAEGDEEIATDWWFFDGGETPLHHAAAYNHNTESIRFLIAQSIDVNVTAENGGENGGMLSETPLSRAIRYKNLEATLELLKAGADPNFWSLGEGSNGNMLDIVAMEYLDDNYATKTVIDALMKAGAKINDHYEAEQGEKKAMLLPRRQWTTNDPSENMKYNLSAAEMDKFMMSCTPLIYAALSDNSDVVNILLDYNADPNITNIENKTALDYAEELPEDSRLKKSPAFARLKAATTVENKAIESDLDFDRADKLVGEGKIPMYIRDKGRFFYNHDLQEIKSGRVAVNVQKLNLRS